MVVVAQLDDVVKIRKFTVVRPGCLFCRAIYDAITVAGTRACKTIGNGGGVPSRPRLRLINVAKAFFPKSVDADVGHIQGQIVGDGALDVQIPLGGVTILEVRIHGSGKTGLGRTARYARRSGEYWACNAPVEIVWAYRRSATHRG